MVFSDPLAEGALRAITDAGRIDTTLISGQGGGADGIHFLRTTKQWVIEPSVFNTTWSELAMAMVQAWADGTKLPPLTTVLQKVMTKQNVSQVLHGEWQGLPPAGVGDCAAARQPLPRQDRSPAEVRQRHRAVVPIGLPAELSNPVPPGAVPPPPVEALPPARETGGRAT